MKNNNTVYEMTWRNKFLTTEAESMEEMAKILIDAGKTIMDMQADGVELLEEGMEDDYATFTTTDPLIAEKYGMQEIDLDEDEEFDDEEDEDE